MPRGSNGNGRRQPDRHAYPRPLLVRGQWTNLNGIWDFLIDPEGGLSDPQQIHYRRQIVVPFAPECPASGVHETGFFQACWYRRRIPTPACPPHHRCLLHFGAVDWDATLWINNRLATRHEGGYTPFFADITDLLADGPTQEITLRAFDDPHDLAKPRGKQDWLRDPHSIWYYRTTGIWQTVWLEIVPPTHIANLVWSTSVERWEIALRTTLTGPLKNNLKLRLRLTHKGVPIIDDSYAVIHHQVDRTIRLPDPGIDDARHEFLWSPSHPTLLHAQIDLLDGEAPLDRVESYTAMRSVALQSDRFILNGRPYFLRLALDQGYWPESGLTAPSDEALRQDVELAKRMGFNGVRKHQKIEDPRYLHWADTLGLLVWEEMPSPYTFSETSIRRLIQTWLEAIERDISHPCIIAWVPFNESWGVPNLPDVPAQRHLVKAIYHLTKSLDPSRPVVGNDGWESVATDIIAIHDYDADPRKISQRYSHKHSEFASVFQERPGHRIVILDDPASHANLPIMLTEFGGIAYSKERGAWGYSRARSPDDFAARYATLLHTVRQIPIFAGFCYTQFTDTYQEANGLLYMDRTPKFPLDQIAIATRGAENEMERRIEATWRERTLALHRQQEESTTTS